jgi:hypothetical protein
MHACTSAYEIDGGTLLCNGGCCDVQGSGECVGVKVNTSKERTHSLFRQGAYWYGAIPNMREDWLRDLMPSSRGSSRRERRS